MTVLLVYLAIGTALACAVLPDVVAHIRRDYEPDPLCLFVATLIYIIVWPIAFLLPDTEL